MKDFFRDIAMAGIGANIFLIAFSAAYGLWSTVALGGLNIVLCAFGYWVNRRES
jgi:hypothetical protein